MGNGPFEHVLPIKNWGYSIAMLVYKRVTVLFQRWELVGFLEGAISIFCVMTIKSDFSEALAAQGWFISLFLNPDTVDGSEFQHQLRLVADPSIYRGLYIPGGAGILPSAVSIDFWCRFFWG